ncbi:MAG: DUF6152 family protein [Gammaproteobacteria bacterium]
MRRLGLIVCVLGMSAAANAHHSFGAFYDMDGVVELEGEITSVFWRNPHIRFTLDVVDDSGAVASWDMEAGSVNTLQRFGISEEVISVGSRISVAGPPSRHGLNTMFVVFVVPPGGDEVVLNPNLAARIQRPGSEPLPKELALDDEVVADAEDAAVRIFRVWTPRSRPNTGSGTHVWPLTPAGQAARDAWDPLQDDPALRCIPPGIPVAMDNPYPIDFMNRGDTIIMRLEEWDGVRVIHMNADANADDQRVSHMGFSVGRWEGDTLIVTTTAVDYPFFDDVGTPQSPDAEIVELFTLSESDTRLDWEATVTDSLNFTEPVTLSGYWGWVPGEQIKPYECTLQAGA